MGVEFQIAECSDFLDSENNVFDTKQFSHMFPKALRIPGTRHILYGILEETLQNCMLFPEFQASVKVVSRVFRNSRKRDYIQEEFKTSKGNHLNSSDILAIKSLRKGVADFIDWRWTSFHRTLEDIQRMSIVIHFVFKEMPEKQFKVVVPKSDRDRASAALRNDVAKFMEFSKTFYLFSKPINDFSTWVTGCDCHEKERLSGKPI